MFQELLLRWVSMDWNRICLRITRLLIMKKLTWRNLRIYWKIIKASFWKYLWLSHNKKKRRKEETKLRDRCQNYFKRILPFKSHCKALSYLLSKLLTWVAILPISLRKNLSWTIITLSTARRDSTSWTYFVTQWTTQRIWISSVT